LQLLAWLTFKATQVAADQDKRRHENCGVPTERDQHENTVVYMLLVVHHETTSAKFTLTVVNTVPVFQTINGTALREGNNSAVLLELERRRLRASS
jgi:hypothetical protein